MLALPPLSPDRAPQTRPSGPRAVPVLMAAGPEDASGAGQGGRLRGVSPARSGAGCRGGCGGRRVRGGGVLDDSHAAVWQDEPLGDEEGGYQGGPVHAEVGGVGGRGGGVEAGVAAEEQFHGGVGEAPAHPVAVAVFHGDLQVGGGLGVGRRVWPVEAQQPDVDVVVGVLPAEHVEQLRLGGGGFGLDVQAGEHEGHGVAVAADVVDRHLQLSGRRAAAGPADPHPVGVLLR